MVPAQAFVRKVEKYKQKPERGIKTWGKKKNTERTDSLDDGKKFQPSEKDGFPCGLFALTKLPQMQRNRVSTVFYTRL